MILCADEARKLRGGGWKMIIERRSCLRHKVHGPIFASFDGVTGGMILDLSEQGTGCVFGGKLTALRYPEKEIVSVPANRVYYEPAKPLASAQAATVLSQQHEQDDLLDIDDVIGKTHH
jgi:hypothetical protein